MLVTSTLFFLGYYALTLFYLCSTHSIISVPLVSQENFELESLLHVLTVSTPVGVDLISKNRVNNQQLIVTG